MKIVAIVGLIASRPFKVKLTVDSSKFDIVRLVFVSEV